MKKFLIWFLVTVMIFGLVGCGDDSDNNRSSKKKSQGKSSYSDNNNDDDYDYNDDDYDYNDDDYDDYDDYADNNATIEYISDRSVQYDSANKHHIVFFGLQDASGRYLSASGKASISITDESNTVLFKKDISFSSKDFTDWTNQQWDSSRYLCGLYIKDSELQGSASSSGTLALKVTLDNGVYFDEKTLNISDLPSISVKVNLPTIPSTYTDTRYSSYTSTVQVTKLDYKSEVGYDGEATLYFNIIIKLVSKTANKNESSTVCVGYKLYDSAGIVVDSGQIYSDPLAVGESSKDTFNIYDLNPRDTYTLKFTNAS